MTRSTKLLLIACCSLVLLGADATGCGGLLPSPAAPTTKINCATVGALTCASPTVPNNEVCCVVATGQNAAVGYLCAYGADKQPAGCFATLEAANETCYAEGMPNRPVGIVRCTQ